jgi:hypothetical protein
MMSEVGVFSRVSGPSVAPGPARRSGRRRVVAAAVFVLVIVVVAFAIWIWPDLSAPPAHPVSSSSTIDLLPSVGTHSYCISGDPGVPRPVYPLDDAVLQANTYNVPSGTTGHVGMCYDAATGAMLGYANWSKVGSAGGWFSYPQITYGVNFWYGPYTTYTNESSLWTLPQTVAAVTNESVWFTANYALHAPPSANTTGYDLSFDFFLMQPVPSYYQVGPFVEVEIFLAHNVSYPFQWIPWSSPTLVNGTVAPVPWDVAYWCHGPTPNNGSNENVSFDFSLDGQSTHGLASGQVGIDLSAILEEVEGLMPSVSCWQGPVHGFSSFHLDEANLGSEDGAIGGASYAYNWTVDDECIHANVTAPSTTTTSC